VVGAKIGGIAVHTGARVAATAAALPKFSINDMLLEYLENQELFINGAFIEKILGALQVF